MVQIITQPYLILPGTAQAKALTCVHDWRDLEEDEDSNVGFLGLVGGRLAAIRPCRHCVAALVVAESPEGIRYTGAILCDADENARGV